MPPAKRPANEESRAERERPMAASTHPRSKTNGTTAVHAGSGLKDSLPTATDPGNGAASGQSTGISWPTFPTPHLNTYRVAHNLPVPAAFSSPYHQALLTNPGLGRSSPTMARRKDKRRVAKETLALAVRKNFNSAAVSETDVVVELVYRVRHQDQAFRMRSLPSGAMKKP
ncbi:hypothetical protein LTR53_013683 [Teratosphaeriaceae sp. CCFEE 6253]|nr:hypothetical protein LTR53_013683 [Teratosphaeriaceae sp. CCFEE 6253]